MFKRMTVAAMVMGAALTVLPAGAFAQDRDDYRYARHEVRGQEFRAQEFRAHEFREHARRVEHERAWRAHERREIRRDYYGR